MTVQELYNALETRIPRSLSCPWDNDGMSVSSNPQAKVTGIVVALDLTEEVIRRAKETGSNVILTHHPLLFKGIKTAVYDQNPLSNKVVDLIQNGISAMAFHTRLDTLDGGVNDTLADLLGLEDVTSFGDCDNPQGKAMGRIGSLPSPMSMADFVALVKARLHAKGVAFADCGKMISRVAVLGGSGGDDLDLAAAAGADVYVTGELKYHQFCDAPDSHMSVVAAGHDSTEYPICAVLSLMASEICTMAGEVIPVSMVKPSAIQHI